MPKKQEPNISPTTAIEIKRKKRAQHNIKLFQGLLYSENTLQRNSEVILNMQLTPIAHQAAAYYWTVKQITFRDTF